MKTIGAVVALLLGLLFAYATVRPITQSLSSGSLDPAHAIVWLFTGAVAVWLFRIAYRDPSP